MLSSLEGVPSLEGAYELSWCHQRIFVTLSTGWRRPVLFQTATATGVSWLYSWGYVWLVGRSSLWKEKRPPERPFPSWSLPLLLLGFPFLRLCGRSYLHGWTGSPPAAPGFQACTSPSQYLSPFPHQHFSDVRSLTELSAAGSFSLYIFAFFPVGISLLMWLLAPSCFWCLQHLPI